MSVVSPLSSASQPRSLVRIAGKHVAVPISWTVTKNGHGVLDSADVTLPIKNNPDWAQAVQAGQPLPIEIYAGFPPRSAPNTFTFSDLSLRFSGTVDPMQPKFDLTEQTCQLSCLSLGAILSIEKTTTNLGNANGVVGDLAGWRTSDYIRSVAKKYGFTADVRVNHPSTMQEVYTTQQIVGVKNMRYWDILMLCAQTDGAYLWFSSDKMIHYVDPSLMDRPIIERRYNTQMGMTGFTGSHAPQFAKNIRVEVRSYEPKQMVASRSIVRQTYDQNGKVDSVTVNSTSRSFKSPNFGNPGQAVISSSTRINADGTKTVTSSAGSSISSGGEQTSGYTSIQADSTAEKYVFKFHGLSQAQCDKQALILWRYLSSHEYRSTFSVPVSASILPSVEIETKWRIGGLPWYSFDQDYLPIRMTESFEHSDGVGGGWSVQIIGINHRLPEGMI